MTSLEAALRRIDRDLAQARYPFALVGGLAVSARTEPRFTRDADLAVAVGSDAEAEALVLGLRASGYRIASVLEQETVGRLATVRLAPLSAPQAAVIDLLFASSGIEAEIVAAAETIELLPRLPMRVATVGHLIALKVLSRDDETPAAVSGPRMRWTSEHSCAWLPRRTSWGQDSRLPRSRTGAMVEGAISRGRCTACFAPAAEAGRRRLAVRRLPGAACWRRR